MTEHSLDATIARQLDALCALFDDELERQENVAALCRAQGEAARARDLEAIEARTKALALVIEEALRAEKQRIRLLNGIVAHFGLPIEQQTLSQLIAVVPDPWRRRMQDFQRRIKAVLAETRILVRRNAHHVRRAVHVLNDSIDLVIGFGAGSAYQSDGQRDRSHLGRPVLVNAHG